MEVMDLLLSDDFEHVWLHQEGEDHETTEKRLQYFLKNKAKLEYKLFTYITEGWDLFDINDEWVIYHSDIEYWTNEQLFETPLNLFLKEDEYKLKKHSVLDEHVHYMILSVRIDKIETLKEGFGYSTTANVATTPTCTTQTHPTIVEFRDPTT